ncbi:MAG: SirB2 family protein [Mariprofundaceae bacterium]|nr:SirB2 family protein [Mariprofundaceae bacterium]
MSWLLPLHISCVSMLFVLFIWRFSYIWQGQSIPYPWLKRGLPDVVDICVLMTGVSLAMYLSINPWADAWFALKLLFILLYIVMGFICFSGRFSLQTKCISGVTSIALLFGIVYVVMTRNINFS